MNKILKIVGSSLLIMIMACSSIHADEADGNMSLTFEGNSEDFITYESNTAYESIMPGEERTQRIILTNNDYREMKYYVRSEYVNPLGEGVSKEGIAYDISFSNNGEVFYNGKIGGVSKANMNSLSTNYLLKTLEKGETTTVELNVKVDGDSMDNSYQGTEGNLNFVFSVEYDENTPIETVVTTIQKIPVINKIPGVSTGDTTTIGLLLAVFGACVIILVIFIVSKLKKGKDQEHEKD